MSDEPITTPRRQRFLLDFPYGLSSAAFLTGLAATGITETTPLPASPEKPVEAPHRPIGPDVTASFERPKSSPLGIQWVRRKDPIPSAIKHCPCGHRISGNKTHCARRQKMSTGWFGIPGKIPPANVKVHVFQDDIGKTLCGWTPSREHQFQWCAHGINLPMIDCSKCRATAKKFLAI